MSRRPTKADLATTADWGWTTPAHQHQLHKACTNIARRYPTVNPDDLYQDSLLYIAVRNQYHQLTGNQWTQMCYRVAGVGGLVWSIPNRLWWLGLLWLVVYSWHLFYRAIW